MGFRFFIFLIFTYFTSALLYSRSDINESKSNDIHFLFYQGPTVDNYTRIPYTDGLSVVQETNFNISCETVFYFPGWGEKPSNHVESVDTVAAAFLRKKFVNLIVLDYAELVQADRYIFYLDAVSNVTDIGNAVGEFLQKYIPVVQPREQVRLVGHSLGSQIMSHAATAYGQGKLKHLTGLDPAGPLFDLPYAKHLERSDAEFVDVIHTDGGYFGELRSIGHADFFPNLGTRVQPYCEEHSYSFCSHHMSWRYYAESVNSDGAFPAKQCKRGNLFCRFNIQYCDCSKFGHIANMGYGVNNSARGDFYLRTAEKSPFGLKEKGFYV